MSPNAKSRFDAATVVMLKMHNGVRRLDITFVDHAGTAHVVSLPVPAAMELAQFVQDACGFMTQLRQRR